jgi:hypothetical protein
MAIRTSARRSSPAPADVITYRLNNKMMYVPPAQSFDVSIFSIGKITIQLTTIATASSHLCEISVRERSQRGRQEPDMFFAECDRPREAQLRGHHLRGMALSCVSPSPL